MTRHSGRAGRPGVRSCRTALVVLALATFATAPVDAAGARKHAVKAAAKPVATARASATAEARRNARASRSRTHSDLRKASDSSWPELSYSDEFERAELVERMLNECRGIPYNAYELAQS